MYNIYELVNPNSHKDSHLPNLYGQSVKSLEFPHYLSYELENRLKSGLFPFIFLEAIKNKQTNPQHFNFIAF